MTLDAKTTNWLAALALSASLIGCGRDRGSPTDWAEKGVARSPRTAPTVLASAASPALAPAPTVTPETKTAAVAPTQPKKAKPASDGGHLKVKRLVVAPQVKDREPVDPATSFKASDLDRLYAFVEVENADRAESEIFVTFEPEQGPSQGLVTLEVGAAPRWRTWAWTRTPKKVGTWEAVVRNTKGEVLARTPFEITS